MVDFFNFSSLSVIAVVFFYLFHLAVARVVKKKSLVTFGLTLVSMDSRVLVTLTLTC